MERKAQPGLLKPLPIPAGRWQSISMDFITCLPQTTRQNEQIWVMVDRLTKFAKFIPLKASAKSQDIAVAYLEKIFPHFGLPEEVISDRDPKFTGGLWSSFFQASGTRLNFSSGDHPETDGQTEHVNQVLEDMLRCSIAQQKGQWDKYLPLLEFAYNNSKHRVTKMTPFYAMMGRHPRTPLEVHMPSLDVDCRNLVEELDGILKLCRTNLLAARDRMKSQVDQHRTLRTFNVGDKVFLRVIFPTGSTRATRKQLREGRSDKLAPRYAGPYPILEKVNEVAYRLQLPDGCGIHPVFHVSNLKGRVARDEQLVEPVDAE